jgi:predicted metal-dependent HD superfamily phosphohydrolase
VLQSFLARGSIYATDQFQSRYEAAARRNLKSAIAALR